MATLSEFTFNLSYRQYKIKKLITNLHTECPVINKWYVGYRNRYAYISYRNRRDYQKDKKKLLDNTYYDGFLKYDLIEQRIIQWVPVGDKMQGGEVQFYQRDGRDPVQEEDNGYVMGFVHNYIKNTSHFVMWDAMTLVSNPHPFVVADLPTRVPYGLHGCFVHESDL